MVDYCSNVKTALEAACTNVFYFGPDGFETLPAISYRDSGNSSGDSSGLLTNLSFEVSVFSNTVEECHSIAALADTAMRSLGFRCVLSQSEESGSVKRQVMKYEGVHNALDGKIYPSSGMISDITLGYKGAGTSDFAIIGKILEVPDIGNKVEKIDVTTLSDTSRQYLSWIDNSEELVFKFLYDNSGTASPYRVLKELEGAETDFEVAYPDGTKYDFTAKAAVCIDSSKPGKIQTFSATLILNSSITVTNPS